MEDVFRTNIRKEYRENVLLRDGRNEKRTRRMYCTTHQELQVFSGHFSNVL
jgi:hypothetical protein